MSELWSSVLRRLSDQVASQNFDMWLRPIECCAIDGSRITLRAPNRYIKEWFEAQGERV